MSNGRDGKAQRKLLPPAEYLSRAIPSVVRYLEAGYRSDSLSAQMFRRLAHEAELVAQERFVRADKMAGLPQSDPANATAPVMMSIKELDDILDFLPVEGFERMEKKLLAIRNSLSGKMDPGHKQAIEDVKSEVLDYITDNGEARISLMSDAIGERFTMVNRAVRDLVREGTILIDPDTEPDVVVIPIRGAKSAA